MKKIIAFGLAMMLCFSILGLQGCNGDYIECPDFVGKKYDLISTSDRYDIFNFEVTYVESDKDDIGIVVAQSVAVGTKIEHDSTINLQVSLGAKKAGVPNAVGQSLDLAKQLVMSSGFGVSVVYAPNKDFEEGICFKTEPKAEEQFVLGDVVTIYISTGDEKKFVPYVNVVGKTYKQAEETLSKAGFNIGKVIYKESEQPEGTIIEQFPMYVSSIKIVEGSSVNIIIAKGKNNEE